MHDATTVDDLADVMRSAVTDDLEPCDTARLDQLEAELRERLRAVGIADGCDAGALMLVLARWIVGKPALREDGDEIVSALALLGLRLLESGAR